MKQTILNYQTPKYIALILGLLLYVGLQAQPNKKMEFNIVHHGDVKGTGNSNYYIYQLGNLVRVAVDQPFMPCNA